MTVRTNETTVTFMHSFEMTNAEAALPAGTYRVVTDDEELGGLSFVAYRRLATMLLTPSLDAPRQERRTTLSVSQVELDAALMKDKHQTV